MPKILENVRERILAEAQRQITENGYGKTTLASFIKAMFYGLGANARKNSIKIYRSFADRLISRPKKNSFFFYYMSCS